jgi:uncharacterized protein YdaU (DUF1376 family)
MSSPSPEYICWHENEFRADRAVVRMQPHQRLMYRALCQVARYCETRPYLPDDDNELYILADADSIDHWKANREAILVKFQSATVDGKPMLTHKRVLADAAQYEEWLAQKRGAGKASADSRRQRALDGRSTGAQQSESTERSKEEKEKEVEKPTPASSASEKFPIDTEEDQPLPEAPDGERKVLTRFSELSGTKLTSLTNNKEVRKCAALLVGQHKVDDIVAVMDAVMNEGWWADKITTFPFFYEKFEDKLLPAYTALARAKKAKSQQEVKSAPGAHGNKSGMAL